MWVNVSGGSVTQRATTVSGLLSSLSFNPFARLSCRPTHRSTQTKSFMQCYSVIQSPRWLETSLLAIRETQLLI